jgi:TfoX/Sxy family transcriptional regulator of competence genes
MPGEEADPRFVPVAEAFAGVPGFSLMESKSGAMRGLMHEGKSFGMSSHGRFVLKLDEERVAALVAEGTGKPLRPGAGRVMKGWIEVTSSTADWVALAREAHRLAAVARRPPAKKSKR